MARESTIQVLYGSAATTAPNDLSDGEFAFAHGNDKLFIGANGNNTAVWIGAEILDEDTFTSNSDTSLATQQSIKAYVDSAIGASAGVVSIEGLAGIIDLDANTGITLSTSGGDTITFSGTDATTSAKGVASFASADFSVVSGAVSLGDDVVKGITTDSGALTPSGHKFSILGGEGMDVTHVGTIITVAGEDATTAEKGIASFSSDNFAVGSGVVTIKDGGVANAELVNSSLTVNAGDGLSTTSASISLGAGATLSVNVDDSTIEINTDALRVKDGGITNAKLANSSFVISDGAGNTSDISLGNALTLQGTTNEVTVAESAGTVTIGLPDDVTIAGNLTVNGTVTTIDTVNLVVEDPLIALASNNTASDSVDIGFYGRYNEGSGTRYTGLARDASDAGNKYYLFDELATDPLSGTPNVVDFASATVTTLVANISGGTF